MTATFQVKTVMAESLVSIGDSAIFVIYMNSSGFMEADRILEINPDNRIRTVLRTAWASDHDRVKEIAEVLYDQALLIEGFPISDPIAYSKKVASLLAA